MKKKLLIVTYVDFWRGGAGHRTRLSSIVGYLSGKASITVVFAGTYQQGDAAILDEKFPEITVHFLDRNNELTLEEYVEKCGKYLSGKHFDIALLEYIETFPLLEYIDDSTITILDTHDILSDKIRSFASSGIPYEGIPITFEEEIRIYSRFDHVILISRNDYDKVSDHLDPDRIFLIPHPIHSERRFIRPGVRNISFIASSYPPNVLAIEWFIREVWPQVLAPDLYLNIYGHVSNALAPGPDWPGNILLHGFLKDTAEAYRDADIIINPVKAGAGLKIKNIEALGNGLPLVTTTHGLTGIEDACPGSLLVADSPEEFAWAIGSLIADHSLRKSIATSAVDYARRNFSEDVCFRPLAQLLNSEVPAL